jgi:integrase
MNRLPILSKKELILSSDKELPKYFSKEEIKEIIDNIANERDKLFLNLLWQTGLRVSKAISIRVENIDFYSKILRVKCLKKKTGRI